MWWIVLVASAALIAIGVWLLVRDFLKPRAAAKPSQVHTQTLAETLAQADAVPSNPGPHAVPLAQQPQLQPLFAHLADSAGPDTIPVTRPTGASAAPLPDPLQPGRFPAVETHWERLKPEFDMAVAAVNESMAPLAVSIARPGETTWSLHNRGFGDYRRVRVGGESVAWLRLELAANMSISAHLRSHEARHDMLNRVSTLARPLTASRIAPMLAECLAALATAAPRLMPQAPTSSIAVPSPSRMPHAHERLAIDPLERVAPESRDRGHAWPQWLNRPRPGDVAAAGIAPPPPPAPPTQGPTRTITGWGRARHDALPTTALIDTAVTLVNSAFAETGARLVPASDAMRRDPVGPDSRALSIDVAGLSVGLMLIEPMAGRIDIAVGVADIANFDTARRRSHDLNGLTVHPLAETIATCAWPAIAAAKAGG
jgi:hypothetical protein